jgi:type II pantothenate kinase
LYLDEFGIDTLLAQLRQKVLDERPNDPVAYMANYLEHLNVEKKFQIEKSNSSENLRRLLEENSESKRSSSGAVSRKGTGPTYDALSPVKLLKSVLRVRSRENLHMGLEVRHARLSIGLDIGGSLCKVVFYEPLDDVSKSRYENEIEFLRQSLKYGSSGVRDANLSFAWGQGRFHFVYFETRKFEGALEMLKSHNLLKNEKVLLATGGGAQKYADLIQKELGCELAKGDELSCLLIGVNFTLQNLPEEAYYLDDLNDAITSPRIHYDISKEGTFPYILVNVGSGVSILLVKDDRHFKRVSGTPIGGGTFLGLCKIIAGCSTFEEALDLAQRGNPKNVDMTVGDIYGGDYTAFGLKADTTACCFGKCLMRETEELLSSGMAPEDVARSILNMVSVNIAQLAYLCAMRHNVTRIVFAGNFLRNNPLAMGALSFSINYWSQAVMKAFFLKHEGYFGALGAFLLQDSALDDIENEYADSKHEHSEESFNADL